MPDVVTLRGLMHLCMSLVLLALFGLALVRTGLADETDCFAIEDYFGWVECEVEQARAADALLNDIYGQVMDRMDPQVDATARTNLRDAQRAWIVFRDAECHFQTDGLGSIKRAILAGCLYGLTTRRIEELQYYLVCPDVDMACPTW